VTGATRGAHIGQLRCVFAFLLLALLYLVFYRNMRRRRRGAI